MVTEKLHRGSYLNIFLVTEPSQHGWLKLINSIEFEKAIFIDFPQNSNLYFYINLLNLLFLNMNSIFLLRNDFFFFFLNMLQFFFLY